jgi:hypothetical protein
MRSRGSSGVTLMLMLMLVLVLLLLLLRHLLFLFRLFPLQIRQFHVRVMMVWVRLHEFQVIVGALEDDSQGERGKKKESQFSPTCAYFKGTR